jgi:hypothetical protein
LRKIVEGKRGRRYRENYTKAIPSLITLWGGGYKGIRKKSGRVEPNCLDNISPGTKV